MRSLPVEGLRLRELVFSGYGKRSGVRIAAEGVPDVEIPLSGAHMQLSLPSELTIESAAVDDLAVEWRVEPRADQHIVLERAAVDYPGSEKDWAAEFTGFAGGRRRCELGWAVNTVIIRLAVAGATR